MELIIESISEIASGEYPDAIQFYDTSTEIFTVQSGNIIGYPTLKTNGVWDDVVIESPNDVSPDTGISNLEIKTINGFGLVGSYLSGDTQKMIIYEFAFDLSEYLESGSIKSNINGPIKSFQLSLQNPIDEQSDDRRNVAIDEEHALLSPGAKVLFEFSMGDSEPFEMGSFYIDHSDYQVGSPTVSADGRNLIGAALNDQTLDENYILPFDYIHKCFERLLINANLTTDQFLIEESEVMNSFTFKQNTKVIDAINTVIKATINWKMEELDDGTIVIGSPSFYAFNIVSTYIFQRGVDVFSRKISRDTSDVYKRVCVKTSDFSVCVYREANAFSGWNINANKTLYVDVPEGTTQAQAELYADELANSIGSSGIIESFKGPFKPYLMKGDQVVIVSESGSKLIGLITDIVHAFGKQGFYTLFTVDSGGRLGVGRISDYITKISQPKSNGAIGYEE